MNRALMSSQAAWRMTAACPGRSSQAVLQHTRPAQPTLAQSGRFLCGQPFDHL